MNVKPLGSIATKWAARAQAAGGAYTDGVKASTSWQANTSASANNWGAGVQAAVADGRFAKGVDAAGNDAWKTGAVNKGAARYGPGVTASQDKYSKGFAPFATVLSNLNLPQRFPKGDPQNVNRVQAVVTALRNAKLGR